MRFLPLLAILLVATSAYAAKSTAALKSALASLKESPLNFSYGLVGVTERDDDSQVRGGTLYHDFLISYDITDKDEVRVMPELSNGYRSDQFVSDKKPRGGQKDNWETSYEGVLLRYRRKNLLTQGKHGVDGEFQQRYFYNNNRTKAYGSASTRFYLKRSLGKRFSLKGLTQYDLDHNVSEGKKDRRQRRFLLSTTPSWSFTDQFSGGMVFRYKHSIFEKKKGPNNSDLFELIPHLSYSFAGHSFGAAANLSVFKSNDGKTFVRHMEDSISYELSYTLSVF